MQPPETDRAGDEFLLPQRHSGRSFGKWRRICIRLPGVHNPGRYDRYKPLTGRDEPVIRFLEEDGEILRFLEHTDALVDAHVERYLERGFTHLQVCFGCTGGQHRSVYSAQHTAEHLHRKYGIRVELIHREQQIRETSNPDKFFTHESHDLCGGSRNPPETSHRPYAKALVPVAGTPHAGARNPETESGRIQRNW